MKSLVEYIYEHLNIFEAAFSNQDYSKHDFMYVFNVLNNIKEKNVIKLGDKNTGPFTYLKLDVSDNLVNNINSFIEDIKNTNPQKFNDLFKNISYKVYSDINCENEISINIKNLWTSIFKGDYSGKNSAGASYGQIFESLVCYLYNYGQYNDYKQELIDKWVNNFKVNINDPSYLSWIESSKLSTDLLKDNFGTDYIAYHVDENNLFDKKEDDKYLNICKIFSGKNGIKEVFTKDNNFDNIYDGTEKDKWNAADIVLVNKKLDLDETIEELQSASDGKALNTKLVDYAINEDILPVSLKKIDKNGKIYTHNIETNKNFIKDGHDISDIKIIFGKTYQDDGLTGNFVVDGNGAEIQIRKQAGNQNLSIEAKLSLNKNARGGKGISVVKNKLNIKDNSYYQTFKTNEELWGFFKSNNFTTDINETEFDELSNKYPDLKDRICFRGFSGLYKTWLEKNKNVKDPITEFIKFLWESCTECPGSYYIIK